MAIAADTPAMALAWRSPIDRQHPLVGRIVAPQSGRFLDEAALAAAVRAADLVVLGETHDNPDHHALQARLLAAAAAGRQPALAFEMLEASQQPAVDAAVALAGATAASLAEAVDWDHSGWPPFAFYRPLFELALAARLPLCAANLPRALMQRVVREGAAALPDELRPWLERGPAAGPAEQARLEEEMQKAHCGQLPRELLAPLVLAQRARDAQLAQRWLAASAGRGGILIAGDGHARSDRGVPALLARAGEAAGLRVVAVGLLEVDPARLRPADYGASFGTPGPPFDFVVFTPRAERADPCEGLVRTLRTR